MFVGVTIAAVPPGATIKEQLENRMFSQKEFALRMDMSEKHISNLINGKVQLTYETAQKLESVLGIPAHFWMNLESIYRENIATAQAEIEMEKDIDLSKKFPYSQMAKLEWVERTRSDVERVRQLRNFFEVANLSVIENLKIPGIAYRVTNKNEKSDYALAAWAQKAKMEARHIQCSRINISELTTKLSDIRALSLENPEIFCPRLKEIFADCGIAIVFLPHIGGSFLNGATFVDGNHVVMGVTVRGKSADKFWFNLFHEVYHIISGDINDNSSKTPEQEKACDLFAQNTLISPNDFEQFVNIGVFTKQSICEFAEHIKIDKGIIVRRLQNEKYIPYNRFNDLKTNYVFTK